MIQDVTRYMKRNYADFNFGIVNHGLVEGGGFTIWLSKKDQLNVLCVRKFTVDPVDLSRNYYDTWLANLAETALSLRAECAPQTDAGRLTQDDAIRGWL